MMAQFCILEMRLSAARRFEGAAERPSSGRLMINRFPALLLAAVSAILAVAFLGKAQTPTSAPRPSVLAFEVATVKLDKSDKPTLDPTIDSQWLAWRGATLKSMICEAYKVEFAQILRAPAWADTERYEVQARAASPSTRDQLREMLRSLLAERFNLTVLTQSKALPVHVLTVAKGGVKLKEVPEGELTKPDDAPAINHFHRRASMAQFASLLSQLMGGPIYNGYTGRLEPREEAPEMVVDQTGLNGVYDINLNIDASGHGDFASALQAAVRAVGLRLDVKRIPVDVITVTRLERIPTSN
jgi:uncharacterized protein (TIGR03435 family)